jgi:hypothetical protein
MITEPGIENRFREVFVDKARKRFRPRVSSARKELRNQCAQFHLRGSEFTVSV